MIIKGVLKMPDNETLKSIKMRRSVRTYKPEQNKGLGA